MPVKSKTWNTTPGLNYIQDSELAFATIYSVKREGTGHDNYVTGTTNRTYVHGSSAGTISFPNVFNPGERVFAIYKPLIGGEPDPVCVAVGPITDTLPNGIDGQPYSKTFFLTGTQPFVVSNITKPSWMTITNSTNTISFLGTPDATGTVTVGFDVTNCGGTETFSQDIEILLPDDNFTIENIASGALITSLFNLNFVATSGIVYPPPFTTMTGVHGPYAGIPTVVVTMGSFPFVIRFLINFVLIDTASVTASGLYPFSAVTSYNESDEILIQLI